MFVKVQPFPALLPREEMGPPFDLSPLATGAKWVGGQGMEAGVFLVVGASSISALPLAKTWAPNKSLCTA